MTNKQDKPSNSDLMSANKRPKRILVLAIIGLVLGLIAANSNVGRAEGPSYSLDSWFLAGALVYKYSSIISVIAAVFAILGYAIKDNKALYAIGFAASIISLSMILVASFVYSYVFIIILLPLYLPSPVLNLLASIFGMKHSKRSLNNI